ncbi:MAG: hypothetical protein IJN57_03915 [Oscillospiraceae bacterium]|nr:hypothetical protein [Oscillospiraceae bacterium]
MRLIDADEMVLIESEAYMEAQLKVGELTRKVNEVVHMKLLRLIADTPTIDAVEVVRCKDCKYCDKYRKWSEEEYLGCGINVAEIYSVDPMHYCSHGKRKVGEENAAD